MVPSPFVYFWVSPQTLDVHENSRGRIGASSCKARNLSTIGSSSASLAAYSSSPANSDGMEWVHLPAFKIYGYWWPHASKLFNSSVDGTANSSACLTAPVSSSTSNYPAHTTRKKTKAYDHWCGKRQKCHFRITIQYPPSEHVLYIHKNQMKCGKLKYIRQIVEVSNICPVNLPSFWTVMRFTKSSG